MQTSGLSVRQFERVEASLPVEFRIAEQWHHQVAFSASSGVPDRHALTGASIDLSPGGAGLRLPKFLPRRCRGILRFHGLEITGVDRHGDPRREVIFEHPVSVRRVTLIDHEPTYFVGVSFVDQAEDFNRRIGEVLARIRDLTGAPPANGGAGHA
jgi:c-di-GMP-binding flagellar brake protein YcgR